MAIPRYRADRIIADAVIAPNALPTIVGGRTTATLREDAAVARVATGRIVFGDDDLTDRHSVSVGAARTTVGGMPAAGFIPADGFGTLTASVVEDTTDRYAKGAIDWRFTPDDAAIQRLAAGQTAIVSYTLTLRDPHGATVTQDVAITLVGKNDFPTMATTGRFGVAVEDGVTAVAGDIAFADADLTDRHDVSTSARGTGYRGTFTASIDDQATGDGAGNVRWSFTADNAALQDLAQGEVLIQKYLVSLRDSAGATVGRVVAVRIIGTNDAPVATAARLPATEDMVATGSVTGFVRDPDAGAVLHYALVAPVAGLTLDTNGAFRFDGRDAAYQSIAQGASRDVVAAYSVTDEFGATTLSTLTLAVAGRNDPPLAADATRSVDEGRLIEGQLTVVDPDVPAGLVFSLARPLAGLTLSSDGQYTFDSSVADYRALGSGEQRNVRTDYDVVDAAGARVHGTITFQITGTSAVAVIGTPTVTDVTEDVGVTGGKLIASGTIAVSDGDPGQAGFRTTVTAASGDLGALTIAADGSYTYAVDNAAVQYLGAGKSKVDTFTVTAIDGTTKDVSFTITGVNDPASIGLVQNGSVSEDTNVVGGRLTTSGYIFLNDADQGESMSFIGGATGYPGTRGTLSLSGNGYYTYSIANSDAQAAPGFGSISDTFAVTAGDGTRLNVTFFIYGKDDAPIANPDTATTLRGEAVDIAVLANDVDVDANDTFGLVPGQTIVSTRGVVTTVNADGTIHYDSSTVAAFRELRAGQSLTDTFTYQIRDYLLTGATGQVTVTIQGRDDTPIGRDDSATVNEGAVVTGSVATNDYPGATTPSYTLTRPVTGLTFGADGSYGFDANDPAYDSLKAGQILQVAAPYRVVGADGLASFATLTVSVAGVNDAPVALDDVLNITEDDPYRFNVLRNRFDGFQLTNNDHDPDGDRLSLYLVTNNTPAVINDIYWSDSGASSDILIYPAQNLAAGESAIGTITYGIRDPSGATAQATITVNIEGRNDAPVVTAPVTANVTANGLPVTVSGLAKAYDVDHGAVLRVVDVPAMLPTGITFDAATMSFTFDASVPGAPQGETIVRYGVSDGTATTPASAVFTTPVVATGTAGADTLIGAGGLDLLDGNGGADVLRGLGGDDRLIAGDDTFVTVAGGTGTDTLALSGAGQMLDLTDRTGAARISSIERIDLSAAGSQTLTLDHRAVLALSETRADGVATLTVDGDTADTVRFTDARWTNTGTVADGSTIYTLYQHGDGDAVVRVAAGIVVPFRGADVPAPIVDLANLAPEQGLFVRGGASGDQAGYSLSAASDVNGDGFADFLVGAPAADGGGDRTGITYLVFGSAALAAASSGDGRPALDLATLVVEQGVVLRGGSSSGQSGFSVAAAGDVNGDGLADMIVGAPTTGDGAGQAYVVFGEKFDPSYVSDSFGRRIIDLSQLSTAQGFAITGEGGTDQAGFSVSAAGDVNGDGFADIIVGAPGNDANGDDAGAAYVVYGAAGGFGRLSLSGTLAQDVVDLQALTPDEGFVIRGEDPEDRAGRSVGAAGDVNGDGFADIVVGAYRDAAQGYSSGAAYVVFGTASGAGATVSEDGHIRQILDPAGLTAAQGFVVQGDAAFALAGISVSAAGDVNGDGYADLMIGAPGSGTNSAYVVFGTATGFGTAVTSGGQTRQVVDVGALSTAQGFVIRGDAGVGLTGFSLAAAGDVNGDGFGDMLVGALDVSGGSRAPAAYLLFGSSAGFGTPLTENGQTRQVIDLALLTAAQGFVVAGETGNDQAGRSVSAAGDVNGDGFADLLIGAPQGASGGLGSGQAYVILGGAFGASDAPLTLGGTAAADVLTGGIGDDSLRGGGGADVFRGGAGDDRIVAGDDGFLSVDGGSGSDTLALAAAGQSLDLTDRARGMRIASVERIDLSGAGAQSVTLDRLAVQTLTETRSGQRAIVTVDGGAGDSLHIGDPQGAWAQAGTVVDHGVTYSVYRASAGAAEIHIASGVTVDFAPDPLPSGLQLASLAPVDGFVIRGDAAGDQAGFAVGGAGDVNGDGLADLIVGAPSGGDGGTTAGEAYVVFGTPAGVGVGALDGNGRQIVDLTSLRAAQGFVIQGDAAGNRAGWSVGGAGDVNGDGLADVIVGAPTNGNGGRSAGEAYVVFGSDHGFGSAVIAGGETRQIVDLTTLSAAQGFIVRGDAASDQAGYSVSAAGDVNGDGFGDILVGAKFGDDGGSNAGETYILFGSGHGFGTAVTAGGQTRQVIDLTTLTPAQGVIIQGELSDGQAGYSVSAAGDVNRDGYADVIIGAPIVDSGRGFAGAAYVVFGSATGFGATVTIGGQARQVIDLATLAPAAGFVIQADGAGDGAGSSVSGLGDVNGDGFADIFVGAPYGGAGTTAGAGYVVYGSAAGIGETVTRDGHTRQILDLLALTPDHGFLVQGDGQLGMSMSAAGDVNGDGLDDLLVGAPGGGDAYVLYGTATPSGRLVSEGGHTRLVVDVGDLAPDQGFAIRGVAGDQAGQSVSAAGDVNGDGFADLLVGAPAGDGGGSDAGDAYVIFGGRQGITMSPRMHAAPDAAFGSVGAGAFAASGDAAGGHGLPDLLGAAPLHPHAFDANVMLL